MIDFFKVKYADNTESYSGRFNVSNDYLDISTDAYDLKIAIDEFMAKFEEEYKYYDGVSDADLNKRALKWSLKFKEYAYAYEKCCKGQS